MDKVITLSEEEAETIKKVYNFLTIPSMTMKNLSGMIPTKKTEKSEKHHDGLTI